MPKRAGKLTSRSATAKRRKKESKRADSVNGRPRRVSSGDTAPPRTPNGIQRSVVSNTVTADQEAKINAVKDIVSGVPPHDVGALAKVLESIIHGMSDDDVKVLKKALLSREASETRSKPDGVLSAKWRQGSYPYKNRMLRKNHEKQKYRLQVELLKLQSWVKKTGQKVVIVFEVRDAAGKRGARPSGFWNT